MCFVFCVCFFFKFYCHIFFVYKAIPGVFLIYITLADANSMTANNIYLGSFENHPCSSNIIWKKIETFIKQWLFLSPKTLITTTSNYFPTLGMEWVIPADKETCCFCYCHSCSISNCNLKLCSRPKYKTSSLDIWWWEEKKNLTLKAIKHSRNSHLEWTLVYSVFWNALFTW